MEFFDPLVKDVLKWCFSNLNVSEARVRSDLPTFFFDVMQARADKGSEKLGGEHAEPFHKLMTLFLSEARAISDFCNTHGDIHYEGKVSNLRTNLEFLGGANESSWRQILQQANLSVPEDVDIDFSKLKLFLGTMKGETVEKVIEAYEKKHAKAKDASKMMRNPIEFVRANFVEKFVPETSADTSKALPALEIDEEGPVTINEFARDILAEEAGSGEEVCMTKKEIMAKLDLHFSEIARKFYNDSQSDDHPHFNLTIDSKGRQLAKCAPDARSRPCHLPLWGRVVELATAAKLRPSNLFDIGNDSQNLQLYLDTSQVVNPKRSDFCFGALITPLPSPKEVKQSEAEAKKTAKAAKAALKAAKAAARKASTVDLSTSSPVEVDDNDL